MSAAVFCDRDGVINELVADPENGEGRAPRSAAQLRLIDGAAPALRALQAGGYRLFVVSNQPDHAKGRAPLEALRAVADELEARLSRLGVRLTESLYCWHGPDEGCVCRKPRPALVLGALRRHGLDGRKSWMIGDRDTDVECGQAAGCRAVLVRNPASAAHQGRSRPDLTVADLAEAASAITGALR